MSGAYSRTEINSNQGEKDIPVDLQSNELQQYVNSLSEDFRPRLNTNSRERSET